MQIAANAVRGPQRGAVKFGHGLQAVSGPMGRALCARRQRCCTLGVFSDRRHRTLEKAGQIHNKKTHGRRPWQAGRSTQTQMGAKGHRHSRQAMPQPKGRGLCGRHRCNKAARRESHPRHHGQRGHAGDNRSREGRGRGLHKATHDPGAGVRRPGRQQPSRLAGVHCNNWHFPRWGSGNEGARLLRCNMTRSMRFLATPDHPSNWG